MARYDPLRKLERDRRIVRYAERHPELSMREIGEKYGISRSRVQQILKKEKKIGGKHKWKTQK